MATVYFCFYQELNYFLPRNQRNVEITHVFADRASIKDMIESLGVPHPEVACIQVNGKYIDFSYIVEDGDKINVYPVSLKKSLKPSVSVLPEPLKVARFVLDVHLGKLANSLRLLGFDTLYLNDYDDEELSIISSTQERILLTRDKGLLMRSIVSHGYYVRHTNPQKQIVEILQRYDLFQSVSPFSRCIRCNGLLNSVPKSAIFDKIPENVKMQRYEFYHCEDCEQVYWKGSHYEKLQQFIEEVLTSNKNN